MIDFRCAKCYAVLSAPESAVGKPMACPECKADNTVPASSTFPPPKPQPQPKPQPKSSEKPFQKKPFVACGAEKLALFIAGLIVVGGIASAITWWSTAGYDSKVSPYEVLKGLLAIAMGTLVGVFLALVIRSHLRSLRIIASTHQTETSASPEELDHLRGGPSPLAKKNRLSEMGRILLNDPYEKET